MIAVIDNYDSFTYNLVQYLGELGMAVRVFRNDQVKPADLLAGGYRALVVSPGPGSPEDAGVSNDAIRTVAGHMPILGVCLGHQCIGQVFGGEVIPAPRLMHGKTSDVYHCGDGLFAGIPNPFPAARYHSLVVSRASLPACLELIAETSAGEVMALRHRTLPIAGVQFHPESILTPHGKQLLRNFVRQALATSPTPGGCVNN